ncbi:hypothetical protein M9H77_07118 [Catharanthus roseus]|uniref:Uncharacterized protein n=1 Tax=Catharanthus roseus TaxID=4058 RepID=A0ACC0BUE8_CATRO|nr:hypothetical protein M9H77_07118 [Catharanthus roseus]
MDQIGVSLGSHRPTLNDVDQKSQASMELKLRPMTRARMKKLQAFNRNKDNGMVAYMEKALKNKFEGQGKASKLHPTIDSSPDPTVAGRLSSGNAGKSHTYPRRGYSREGGDPWEGVESKLHSKLYKRNLPLNVL